MATTPNPTTKFNNLGLQILDYRGSKSTLCAGCGHNLISERLVDAFFELNIQPEQVFKFSGIGCSSKTPAYFLGRAHSFNGVHGRMPAIATGAAVSNHKMIAIGISGDGDTASIGTGQFVHLMRRNLPIVYIIENNGVYGLTKGQFSATADIGSKLKSGAVNELPPIDCCALAIELGATFVARSFSGDKKQLLALLKAALTHRGTALIDVISPCVTFNDHEGSTKSYRFMREHNDPLQELDYIPAVDDPTVTQIEADYAPGSATTITLHDGARLRLSKIEEGFNPSDRISALTRLAQARERHEVLTGLFYLNNSQPTFFDLLHLPDVPLASLPESITRPSRKVLDEIMEEHR